VWVVWSLYTIGKVFSKSIQNRWLKYGAFLAFYFFVLVATFTSFGDFVDQMRDISLGQQELFHFNFHLGMLGRGLILFLFIVAPGWAGAYAAERSKSFTDMKRAPLEHG
jgi:hypothetical protein